MVAISSVLNHIINEQVNIIVNMIKIFNDQELVQGEDGMGIWLITTHEEQLG